MVDLRFDGVTPAWSAGAAASYAGGELAVEVELLHRAGFTLQTPVGMSLGVTPDRADLATVVESPAELRIACKTAHGWYEQNLRRSHIGAGG